MTVYTHDAPVFGPGPYTGRQPLLHSLVSGVMSGRSFLVCGGPRLGRSSTLGQLGYQLKARWRRQSGRIEVVPVHYDLARLGTGTGTAKRFLEGLWSELLAAVLDARFVGDAEPVRPPEAVFLRANDPWQTFAHACAELWERLSGTAGWCQWALLLEHGDRLLSPGLEPELPRFAELFTQEGTGSATALVVEGGRLLREELFGKRSPLRFLRPLFLAPLRDSEAGTLVRAGFPEADESWVRAVLATTGKHPYLLQRLLFELELRAGDVRVEDAIAMIEPEVVALFEAIWLELDLGRGVDYRGAYAAPEHVLLQYALDRGDPIRLRQAERDLGIQPLKEYAELLEYLGIFERLLLADETVFVAPCELFNTWYAERVLR